MVLHRPLEPTALTREVGTPTVDNWLFDNVAEQGRTVECNYSTVMTVRHDGVDFEFFFASLIIGFLCFVFCFAVFFCSGLWMDYIPLFKHASSVETALVYAMLMAFFGISCLGGWKEAMSIA